jgi:hypothetical protein
MVVEKLQSQNLGLLQSMKRSYKYFTLNLLYRRSLKIVDILIMSVLTFYSHFKSLKVV